ncbi:MAG: ABC transporter substrate-binding protein [Myxococcales bacterium]|nr:ABC transporter substrate-binding protein [Myxococcales bacterium]
MIHARALSRRGGLLVLAAVAACFEGRWIEGQPCARDEDCEPPASIIPHAPALRCEAGYCGGAPSCRVDADCRELLGISWVCSDEACRKAPVFERCSYAYPEDLLEHPERYKDITLIGSLLDQSNGGIGDAVLVNSATVALDEARSVGIDGVTLGIVHCNYQDGDGIDNLDPEAAAAEGARYLADTLGAVAIIGPGTSALAEHVYETLCERGDDPQAPCARDVLVISPSATSVQLTEIDGPSISDASPGRFWRTVADDSRMGAVMAMDLQARGKARLAILAEDSSYGQGIADSLRAALGPTSLALQRTFATDDELKEQLDEVADLQVDEIVFITSETQRVIHFYQSVAVMDALASVSFMLTDTASEPAILISAEPSLLALGDRVRGVRPAAAAGLAYDTFLATYSARFPGEDASLALYAPHTYDATWLTIYGIVWAHLHEPTLGGRALARGLRRVSDHVSGLQIVVRGDNFSTLQLNFAEGNPVDITGASGPLDYDPATEEVRGAIELWVVSTDGGAPSLEIVERFDP